jgi:hypothetical protein
METEERPLRRSELYALVWEKAVQRVAVHSPDMDWVEYDGGDETDTTH